MKLRMLSLTPSNRAVICRRGVPASLVQFISQSAPTSQVASLAIETLYLLSEEESNLPLLASEPNLISTVQKTLSALNTSEEKAASPVTVEECENSEGEFMSKMKRNAEYHCQELLKRLQPQDAKSQENKSKEKLRKKHTIKFQIENLVQNRKSIEAILLKNSGTISYKFNIKEDYVSVYTRSKTEKLIQLLSQLGKITVLQDSICETEYNNENVLPVVGFNGKKPEYLKKDTTSVSDYKKSLVAVSREDRLKKRKEKPSAPQKVEEDNGGGFLKKLTSVFW